MLLQGAPQVMVHLCAGTSMLAPATATVEELQQAVADLDGCSAAAALMGLLVCHDGLGQMPLALMRTCAESAASLALEQIHQADPDPDLQTGQTGSVGRLGQYCLDLVCSLPSLILQCRDLMQILMPDAISGSSEVASAALHLAQSLGVSNFQAQAR